MEQRFAFVLRIWLAQDATQDAAHDVGYELTVGALRGTLQAADSSEPHYFVSLKQLNQLLLAALRGQAPFPPNDQPPGASER